MKSRISIEVDFENNNQPVIQILQSTNSDDVRDKLLSHFCQMLGGSSWCQIKWVTNAYEHTNGEFNRIHISPIRQEDFKKQAEVMLEQNKVNEKYQENQISELK